jgi:LacI family transcriptional regulator
VNVESRPLSEVTVDSRRRVGIVVELAVGYREAVVRGIWRFIQTHPNWEHQGCELHLSELPALKRWKPDGIIAGLYDLELARALRKLGKPIVDVYNCVEMPGTKQVGIDDRAVGRLAAEYLFSLGLKNVALIGDYSVRYAQERREAFLQCVGSQSGECHQWEPPNDAPPAVARRPIASEHRDTSHVFSAAAWSSRFRRKMGARLAEWLRLLPKPVGLFALNDDWATLVVDQCRSQGISVPEQIAILGVDNAELLCQMGRPPLSSIATPAEKVGWLAGSMLEQLMDGGEVPNRVLLPPVRVVERQSTNVLAVEDADVAAAIRFIHAHVHHGIGVREVLLHVPSRRRSLEVGFRRSLGRSILDEIQRQRIERAKMLLSSTDLKFSVIARRSGFQSASRFCRVFHELTGETPSHYRQRRNMT